MSKRAIILYEKKIYLISRNRKKKHLADASITEIAQYSRREIIDNVVQSFENKIIAYVKISAKHIFFLNFENLTTPK